MKKKNNLFFKLLLISFLLFMGLYIANESGYYEAKNSKKAYLHRQDKDGILERRREKGAERKDSARHIANAKKRRIVKYFITNQSERPHE